MTGKRGVAAVLAIGVRQQSVYQRKTLLERQRHRMASMPAVELQARRRHLEDVGSAGRVEHVRTLEETREHLAVLAVADKAEPGRRGNVARDTAHAAAPASKREVQVRHARSRPDGSNSASAYGQRGAKSNLFFCGGHAQ
jgi:hypothetical protein